ncbi:unnamed protein product [Clonostachys rosea]|uniref:F-box domain-containing protein n=1 Tax=Bionectria ochroleuca TaxID=29856 RepID=A0ABY6TWL8_BIOOC|nr:unnamed protein product [Clonostachys rosea]
MNPSSDDPEFYLGPDEYERPWYTPYGIMKSYCITPRCAYCGYDLELGDRILMKSDGAEANNPLVVTRLPLTQSQQPTWGAECQPRCSAVCHTWRFCACSLFEMGGCKYVCHESQVCHKACHDALKPALVRTPSISIVNYSNARRPSFRPAVSDSQRRRAFMESDLVRVLGECIPNLPWELIYQIASYSWVEHTAAHLKTLMGNHTLCNSSFDLRKDVWAEYIDFEGHRYIQALYNVTCDVSVEASRDSGELIFNAKSNRTADTILIEMSALGIRNMIFTDSSSRPKIEEKSDIWWQVMPFQAERSYVIGETDGIKLRRLKFECIESEVVTSLYGRDLMWPTPGMYDHHMLLRPPDLERPRYPRRMDSVDLRSPDIFGLSFAVFKHASYSRSHPVIRVYAHLPGESHSFYREVERKFKTNQNRVHTIGSARLRLRAQWKVIYSSTQGLRRMFFEHVDDTQLDAWSLGFEPDDTGLAFGSTGQPRPEYRHFFHCPLTHCSSAVLDGVIEVTQCLRIPNHSLSIDIEKHTSGLLLRYRDGHVERLGEARLDLVRSCRVLSPADVLRFQFQRKLVKTCTVGPTQGGNDPNAGYFEVPMHGTLHWCFDTSRAKIQHSSRQITLLQ